MKSILFALTLIAFSTSAYANSGDHDHQAGGHGTAPSHAAPNEFDQAQLHGDRARIEGLLRATFETEVGTLSLNPVVIVGDHAMVGWVQDDRGGRAILKKNGHGLWAVFLCGGSEVRGQTAFETLGLTPTDAMQMAAYQEVEEAKLDKHTIHLMDNFGETIFFN